MLTPTDCPMGRDRLESRAHTRGQRRKTAEAVLDYLFRRLAGPTPFVAVPTATKGSMLMHMPDAWMVFETMPVF